MASQILFDLDRLDGSKVVYDEDQIYARLPQAHEFRQISTVVHLNHESGEAIAYRDLHPDEWWCKAHIPGNPIFPGVLMLEAGAQLGAFMEYYSRDLTDGFVSYGGVDRCKFRRAVQPPKRLWFLCKRLEARRRRIVCQTQGVADDALVFEAVITGLLTHL